MTIGSENEDDDEEEEKYDMRSRMQSFALNVDNSTMPPTIFHDDTEFTLPSTSGTSVGATTNTVSHLLNKNDDNLFMDNPVAGSSRMDSFVKKFFATDTLFQPLDENNVIIFCDKFFCSMKFYFMNN